MQLRLCIPCAYSYRYMDMYTSTSPEHMGCHGAEALMPSACSVGGMCLGQRAAPTVLPCSQPAPREAEEGLPELEQQHMRVVVLKHQDDCFH